ncbi:MAG: pantoate--beta-alanine ligase [Bacteroidales bacterium]|jgi:pantoate--beta-alanine ligase|nr:pantoate--beta-alanine ligase [Bacteroidales bacterium]
MIIVKTVEEIKDVVFRLHSNGKSVGLVPTMGALHKGHLSLVEKAHKENEVVVCSIFVNPVQFNNREDLENYPRHLKNDIAALEGIADIVFAPSVEEVYPEEPQETFNFGNLENVMEGVARPGHFNGVATIIHRFFTWIEPEKAYFGEKDFQQLAIIKELVKQEFPMIEIVGCPICREESGLALSSRNQRLTEEGKMVAANIYRILQESTKLPQNSVENIKNFIREEVAKCPAMELEYIEIVDDLDLQPVNSFKNQHGIVGCIVVFVEGVRLIDNIRYK